MALTAQLNIRTYSYLTFAEKIEFLHKFFLFQRDFELDATITQRKNNVTFEWFDKVACRKFFR